MKTLERLLLILIIFFYPILSAAVGFGIGTGFVTFKQTILHDYLLHETRRSFYHLVDMVQLHLMETKRLIHEPFFSSPGWIEELYKAGALFGAYVLIDGKSYRVGSQFPTETIPKQPGFFIDSKGMIHYAFSDAKGTVLGDIVLNLKELEEMFKDLKRMPSTVSLYDRQRGYFISLLDDDNAASLMREDEALNKGQQITFMDIKRVRLMKMLNLDDSEIYLVALYPLRVGKKGLLLFGLIVALILTILIMLYTIIYIKRSYRGFHAQIGAMSNTIAEQKKSDIVREIDREVSMSVERPEESAIIEKTLLANKIEELAKDGIFIKKG